MANAVGQQLSGASLTDLVRVAVMRAVARMILTR
jgi:hypothetical protein